MRNILITGGAGNIGASLAQQLVQNANNYVVIVDNLLTGKKSNLPSNTYSNWRFVKADVNIWEDISSIMTSTRFDYVFHYAAVVGVKRTLAHPMAVLRDIDGIKNILSLSKNTGVKRIFYSSSSEVYGEPFEIPQNENTTPLNSRLPYAIVKNLGESYCKSFNQEFGLEFTIFRFFNTYGPLQSQDFVMSKFIKQALQNEDISIYGKGNQTRTFCYIDDNLDITIKAMEENKFINDIVNIGSDVEITILDLAQKVIEISNSSSKIKHLPPLKEGDMLRRKPDISKIKGILQRPLTSIDEGIRLLLK